MKKLSILFSLLTILTLVFTFKPAQAADQLWLGFAPCTSNNPDNVAIGLEQIWVKIEPVGTSQVKFTFYNVGLDASSITQIYFADGSLLGIASIEQSAGVDFSEDAAPHDLPGRERCTPVFPEVTAEFRASPNPPVEPNGVNEGYPFPGTEWVSITFDLQTGPPQSGWDDVESELREGLLRVGIHVQGFPDGGSESFASNAYTAIDLMDFRTAARQGNVTVEWTTGTEINNAGFNLYRSSSELGARTKVNETLIAARGDAVSGGSYNLTDNPGYGTFFYWLEDVESGGSTTLHGPVKVTVWPSIRPVVNRPVVP